MNNNSIINWSSVFAKSSEFQKNNPCKWTFVENFFEKKFYDKLYESYPNEKSNWTSVESVDKSALRRYWKYKTDEGVIIDKSDNELDNSWNQFVHYQFSDEFLDNMRKFSGVDINRPKNFTFMLLKKGGYQLPHIHNVGPSTLIIMLYFSKNWETGDPGGTYITPEEDESKMIFEPHNLDNTALIFHDGPYAGHGVRQIEKNVQRRAVQIYLENYSETNGWSGDKKMQELVSELN